MYVTAGMIEIIQDVEIVLSTQSALEQHGAELLRPTFTLILKRKYS